MAQFLAIPEGHAEGSYGESDGGLAAPEGEKLRAGGFTGSPEIDEMPSDQAAEYSGNVHTAGQGGIESLFAGKDSRDVIARDETGGRQYAVRVDRYRPDRQLGLREVRDHARLLDELQAHRGTTDGNVLNERICRQIHARKDGIKLAIYIGTRSIGSDEDIRGRVADSDGGHSSQGRSIEHHQ